MNYIRKKPKKDELWKHFKGHLYRIICVSQDTESLITCVTYRDCNKDQCWTRPLDMFMSEVDYTKYPDAKQKYRFEKVTYHTIAEDVEAQKAANKIIDYCRRQNYECLTCAIEEFCHELRSYDDMNGPDACTKYGYDEQYPYAENPFKGEET